MSSNTHFYYNFKVGVNGTPQLLTGNEISEYNIDPEQDYYISIFRYNEDQKRKATEAGSVAGIRDVVTDTLVWDFDSKDNVALAKEDTITLCKKLIEDLNVDPNTISCYYSGNKGFHVVLPITESITPTVFKNITYEFGKDLKTYDASVSTYSSILRLEYTKHPVTKLFKTPFHIAEIDEMTIDEIKDFSKTDAERDTGVIYSPLELPSEYLVVDKEKTTTTKPIPVLTAEETLNRPARGWKKYKWALAQGMFDNGERHSALIVLAATCRALGYDKESTYYLCKSALKKQSARTGSDEFPKEELWNNIIEQSVFSDRWEGGSYNAKNNLWLRSYCEKMKFDIEDEKEPEIYVELSDLTEQFTKYATNFEQNIIKTGIEELDNNLILSTSTLNGLLGNPGSGKTTFAMNFLHNTSMLNLGSTFFSLDMGAPIVYAKLVQKMTGLGFKKALELYRTDEKKRNSIADKIKQEFRNVRFNFKAGYTVADLRDTVMKQEDKTGVKSRLVVIDYLECISSPYSDATASAGFIANQLKDMANELETCILLLLQTQKHSTPDISDPLLSMKQIKGSSIIEQACSTVLTLWREGYNPKTVDFDKYMSLAVVKNRFGSQWTGDFHWEAVRGNIRSLFDEEIESLTELRKLKREMRLKDQKERSEWQ